jgi:hypothetical protein
MIRRKTAADLTSWIERARTSLVASFGNGVRRSRRPGRNHAALVAAGHAMLGSAEKVKVIIAPSWEVDGFGNRP